MREQIIESAKDIFSRFGFRKTTVDDIARSIHKAKSSIYYYFSSKEEIFEEVIRREYAYLKDRLSDALAGEETPEGKLRAYVITRLRVLLKVSNFYGAITSDYFEYFGLIEKLRKDYVQEEIRVFRGILQEGVQKGAFKIKNIDITAHTVITALKGLEYDWATTDNASELEADVQKILDIVLYGIVAR
ncbi:MAG: TetR/AcrR family transcriptional regulator [Candidatus Altiarchaeota archaeon]|nr:TetR/AcrR family transcriptional regulator [Candidatus Altiarchaeota archaeon]